MRTPIELDDPQSDNALYDTRVSLLDGADGMTEFVMVNKRARTMKGKRNEKARLVDETSKMMHI